MPPRVGLLLFAVCTLCVGVLSPVHAQRTPEDEPRSSEPRSNEERARLEQRMRARVAEIMRDRIGIDEDAEARLSEIAREFEGRRRALRAEERETREQIEAFVRSGRTDNPAATALLERALVIRTREAELFREEQTRLLEVLTPTQLLQVNELRLELGRRIRALRNDAGNANRGGQRGGGEARLESPPGTTPPRGAEHVHRPAGEGAADTVPAREPPAER